MAPLRPIQPGSGYIRLDVRPSKKLQAEIKNWIEKKGVMIPFASAARTLIWLGLEAEGIVSPIEHKVLRKPKVKPALADGDWSGIREDGDVTGA